MSSRELPISDDWLHGLDGQPGLFTIGLYQTMLLKWCVCCLFNINGCISLRMVISG